jgi:hypothetical protein
VRADPPQTTILTTTTTGTATINPTKEEACSATEAAKPGVSNGKPEDEWSSQEVSDQRHGEARTPAVRLVVAFRTDVIDAMLNAAIRASSAAE